MVHDRSDIQFFLKKLCRSMSEPWEKDWPALNGLPRYLIGRTRVDVRHEYQETCNEIDVWTDLDFAGCTRTRRSTSSGNNARKS